MDYAPHSTAIERFADDYSDQIGVAVIVIFGSAMFVSIFFNSTGLALLSMLLLFIGGPINAFLADGPARREHRAFEKNPEETFDGEPEMCA